MWKPQVYARAEYDITKRESQFKLRGNEYFHDVHLVADTLDVTYSGRMIRVEPPLEFETEWLFIEGKMDRQRGEKDTLDIRWKLHTSKPWYRVDLAIKTDTLDISAVESDWVFKHDGNRLAFSWFADPPEEIDFHARIAVEPGARLIREVRGNYPEPPIPLTVTSNLANVRYRTIVTRTDTLMAYTPP
jgi:hypothetical protein